MELQDRIKLLRYEKGMTQDQLAAYLHVARATISGYETKGKHPDLDKLIKLSALFDVSLDYLITGSTTNTREKDFICIDPNEDLLDQSVYQMYSMLNIDSKRDLQTYLRFLLHSALRPDSSQT